MKSYVIISVDAEKHLIKSMPAHDFRKKQTSPFNNLGIERNFLSLIKNITKTSKANMPLNSEILKEIPKIGTETRMSPSSSVQHCIGGTNLCKKRRENKIKYK